MQTLTTSLQQQTLTFAVLCQVAKLVQQCSRTGELNNEELTVLLQSILNTSPENTLAVYGGDTQNVRQGLQILVSYLGNKNKDPEFTRYLINIINLEDKLLKKQKVMATLAERIEQTKRQLIHYNITSPTIIASFASIYSDVISPVAARIQITGEPTILKQPVNQEKIRALLLAGIRTAVLWRQVGGKRRNILFSRTKIVACAKELLQ